MALPSSAELKLKITDHYPADFYFSNQNKIMNWYLAKIVYRGQWSRPDYKSQFDEQLRLIHAENSTTAFEKASRIGRQEEETYFSGNNMVIQWEFVNVSELYQLKTDLDGAELFSHMQETENEELYLAMIHRKAALVRENAKENLLDLF